MGSHVDLARQSLSLFTGIPSGSSRNEEQGCTGMRKLHVGKTQLSSRFVIRRRLLMVTAAGSEVKPRASVRRASQHCDCFFSFQSWVILGMAWLADGHAHLNVMIVLTPFAQPLLKAK